MGILKTITVMISGAIAFGRGVKEKELVRNQMERAQKMEAIGILAGGVAHDFNNILTIIQGRAQIMQMEIEEDDPLNKQIESIIQASSRAQGLIRQLLLFSRKEETELQSINLNKNLKELLKMLRRLIGEDVSIKIELAPDLWKISADPGNIEQVVMNLTVNARDAMSEGGKIVIKTLNVDISDKQARKIPHSRPGKFVCLSLEDSGEGISEDVIEKIFDPFFTTKEKGKGTGLGLSTVYGIIKKHQGWVNVSSVIEKGTIFKIYLPALFKIIKGKVKENGILMDLSGSGERILVVEDDKKILCFVEQILTNAGYVVEIVENAEAALKVFGEKKGRFDLLLSDVVMPGKSGLELADLLTKIKPELKVLLASGYLAKQVDPAIIRERGYGFIRKPFAIDGILNEVKRRLQQE